MKKKIEVVELNKKEEKIIVKEHPSIITSFYKKYNKLILLILLIISLTVLTTGIILTISNISSTEQMVIKKVSIDTDLNVSTSDITAGKNTALTDDMAKKIFQNKGAFKTQGAAILVKTVSKKNYIIKFYSDFTAVKIMNDGSLVTRINSIDGNKYGIQENGVTDLKAETLDVTVTDTKKYNWGEIKYYSDGSAEISKSEMDIFVRNSQDIKEEYITENKISYLKETKNLKGTKVNYYYDGTIEITKGNESYIVRDKSDINITDNNVTFLKGNEATVIKTEKLKSGQTIYYYSDGGAIIKDGNNRLSVRKSNSIIIKDDKIYEIVDNIYVDISKTSKDGNVIYYTNGSAVIKNYNGQTVYVKENSDIKYENGRIINIGTNYEKLTEQRTLGGDSILIFETISVVDTEEFIAIVPKDSVIFDTDGTFKDIITDNIDSEDKPITITNSTNEPLKYRLVIEQSKRTNLDSQYIKYQLSVGDKYIEPTKLNNQIWKTDIISSSLSVTGINYVLIERTLEPAQTDQIRLMLWTDYETIPNSMQNKYFYGTLRIYAWKEIEINV